MVFLPVRLAGNWFRIPCIVFTVERRQDEMSEWEKLWEYEHECENVDAWIKQVKAVGDKLQEENKQLRAVSPDWTTFFDESMSKMRDKRYKIKELNEKLEAIREILKKPYEPTSYCFQKLMKIEEVLGE